MERLSLVGEILQMVIRRRAWALVPVIVALTLVGALIVIAELTPLGPLVYPLF